MKRIPVLVVLALFPAIIGTSQVLDRLTIEVAPHASVPLAGSAELFKVGGGVSAEARLSITQLVSPFLRVKYNLAPTPAQNNLTILSTAGGARFQYPLTSRLGIGVDAGGGYYVASWDDESTGGFLLDGAAIGEYRITPAFSVSVAAGYDHYLGPNKPLYTGASVSLIGGVSIGGLRGGNKLKLEQVELDPVFPVFHTHYDVNPLGTVRFTNREDGEIQDVRVSFFAKQYMDQPKVSATYESVAANRSVETPLYALFTDDVLKLTESTRVAAEIIVDYTFLGSERQARFGETLRLHHRNAMTWDDDRKAAAFVSAKDPAVLRFSKFAAGLFREAGGVAVNENFRFAMGLFEGLRLYGLNYVIDPTTPYEQMSATANALDYLQFPYQTLVYRGGDCDDLSVMYAAVLESVGIRTAFITIPGHIFMAFDLDMDEDATRTTFANPDELIMVEGRAWVPVEVTLLNEGFTKAWLVGAKQWRDNSASGTADLFGLNSAWESYEPVGIPGEDSRIVLPEAEPMVDAYQESLAHFVEREVRPQADKLQDEIRLSNNNPRLVNRLGVLYARFGMYEDAANEFGRAIRANYLPALVNMGNVSYLQKQYQDALGYYERALDRLPDNKNALLGMARAQYELENYAEADSAYQVVQGIDPSLAAGYPYLASASGGDGLARASAAATQRTGGAAWQDE